MENDMTNIPDSSEQKLHALSEAVRAMTAEFELERILHRIAEIAAQLVNARFAALGLPDGKGGLEQFLTYGMTDKQIGHMDHYPLGLGLLGELLKKDKPIRLDDMRTDPRSAGFCQNHPKMTSFLGVPITSKGHNYGNLYLCDKRDGTPFTDEDERLILLLAGHAAIAIENARLSDQLRKLAVIEERDRISMELHDGIIQSIYAVGIKLELVRPNLNDKPDVAAQIGVAVSDLNHVIEDLRRYIRDLRVGVNHTVYLHEQLEEISRSFRQVSSARLVMDVARGFTKLTDERLHSIIQVIREALSNIVRHAHASEVYLDLHEEVGKLILVISDNGRGFDSSIKEGQGLPNIRQRIAQIGGTVDLVSQPGRGTTVTVTFTD